MSSGAIILPAINRGTHRTISQSSSGIFAYASRNNVYFIDTKTIPPIFLDSLYLFDIHRSKIVVLSFSKYDGPDVLATCCEDGELKIWDVEKKACLQTIETKEVNVLEWVYGSPDTLVFSSDGRFLLKYSVRRNTQIKIRTASEFHISVISASEKSSECVAAGHYNGVISVINVVQEKLVYKLKAHHAEITDLSWNHDSSEMLLSLSLDLSVRLWKLGENSPQNTYYAPYRKSKNDDKKSQRLLGLFHPTKQGLVICVNTKGEVGEISMDSENSKFVAYTMKNFENNLRYPIALFLSSCKEYLYGWDSFKVTKLDILKKELVTNFPFVMGFVYDLSISRVNPNLLSISNGDGILRVYDGCSQSDRLNVTSIYIYFKTKVMTAAWHPRSENILAYATDEGRVGIVDTFKKKSMYCFETHHTGAVYSLTWGTCAKVVNAEPDDLLYLYSCGGGTVYVNKENSFKTKALDFDELTERPDVYHDSKHSYSETCWNFDCTLFCVGSFKGFVELYDSRLNFLGRLIVPMKSVESLRWHPETTYMSPGGSPLKSWLACSGSENEIFIFDSAMTSSTKPEVFMFRPIKKLVGHKKRVVSLSWSEHSDGFLASASKDGSAMVWNVVTQTCIATFLSHFDVVLSVQWSVTDKDVIYSGGQGGSVRSWKITEQTPKPAPDKAPIRKKLKRPKKIENKTCSDVTEADSIEPKKDKAKSDGLSSNLNVQPLVNGNNSSKEVAETKIEAVGSEEVKQKKSKVVFGKKSILFPTHNFEENACNGEDIESCKRLAEILSGKYKKEPCFDLSFDSMKKNVLNDDAVLKFGLYTDQATALRMLDVQSEKFLSGDNLAAACDVALFSGNIKQVLLDAAEKKKLTVSHVSLAPAVSHSFWLEICEKFASQLIDTQSYFKAAQYYLICGNIHAAVDLLANRGNLVDAVALAKARLPDKDPIISKLLITLKRKYEMSKNTAAVIQCELALNEPLKAAKMLAATSDPHAIKAASYICLQYELNLEATEYLFSFLETCLVKYNYKAFEAYVEEEPFLQPYEALLCVHQDLHEQVRYLRTRDGLSLQNIFKDEHIGSQVKVWSGVVDKDIQQPFINVLHSILLSRKILTEEKCPLTDILKALKILEERRKSLEVSSEAHIPMSIFLTEYILLSQRREETANEVLLKIFQTTHNICSLPRILCLLFFPISIHWNEKAKNFKCEILSLMGLNADDNNFINYALMCQSIVEKIQSFKVAEQESLFTKEDLHNNLSITTLKIKQVLLSKKTDELLFLYFFANLTCELQRIINKQEPLFDCYVKNELNLTSQNAEIKNTFCDPNFIIVNDSNKNHNGQNDFSVMTNAEIIKGDLDHKNLYQNLTEEDTRVEANEEKKLGDTIASEAVINDVITINTNNNKDVFTSDIGKNIPITIEDVAKENKLLSVDLQNYLSAFDNQASIICDNNGVDKVDSQNNEITGNEDNMPLKQLNSIEMENDFADEHDLQLQELIQSVIEEADLKAQAIIEKNGPVIENKFLSEECSLEEARYYSLNSSSVKNLPCKISESETVRLVFDQKIDDEKHESCLTKIDLFYNIISLISQSFCKDEFALLYYLKERLNSLNNVLSATVLSEMSKEFSKKNKGKANKNSKKRKPKDSQKSQTSDNISVNKNADQTPPTEQSSTCDIRGENKNADQTPPTEKSSTSDNIGEDKNADPTPPTEKSSTCDNVGESKNADQNLLTELSSISDKESKNTENNIALQENCVNDELLSENETVNDANEDANSAASSDSHSIQSSEEKNSQSNAYVEEEKEKLAIDSNEVCVKDEASIITTEINPSDNSHASSESATNTKEKHQKIISSEILQQEHKIISDALAMLEENAMCCMYPNPFDVLSKLSDAISDVISKSGCHLVKCRLHKFLHSIIFDWTEKFCVGEIKFVCKLCEVIN